MQWSLKYPWRLQVALGPVQEWGWWLDELLSEKLHHWNSLLGQAIGIHVNEETQHHGGNHAGSQKPGSQKVYFWSSLFEDLLQLKSSNISTVCEGKGK